MDNFDFKNEKFEICFLREINCCCPGLNINTNQFQNQSYDLLSVFVCLFVCLFSEIQVAMQKKIHCSLKPELLIE